MKAAVAASIASDVTTPLTSEIETLVANVQGYSPLDELFTLSMLVYATAHLPGDIVEVGSWHGRSAVVLGSAARATGGLVHCVDLFPARDDWQRNPDGTYSFTVDIDGQQHGGYREQTVWSEPFESQLIPAYEKSPNVFDTFLANVRRAALTDVVRPHRGTSATFRAGQAPSFQCRLLFIDGDHGYEAVKADLESLAPLVVPGGWVCFDDAFSTYPGVDRAITELVIASEEYDVKRQLTRKCFAARKAPRVEIP